MDQFLTRPAGIGSMFEGGCSQRLQQVHQEAERCFKLSRVGLVFVFIQQL